MREPPALVATDNYGVCQEVGKARKNIWSKSFLNSLE